MLEKYGVEANELRIVGGGSKNPLWRRIIADAFQVCKELRAQVSCLVRLHVEVQGVAVAETHQMPVETLQAVHF